MKQFITLGNLAQFSKFLNSIPIAKPTTKFGQGRAVIQRLRNAQDHLIMKTKNDYEGLYHLNSKGKASKYSTLQDPAQVQHLFQEVPKQRTYTIHNHPQNSSLSSGDMMVKYDPNAQQIAVDKYGSRYRFYPKTNESKQALDRILDRTQDLETSVKGRLKELSLETPQERILAYTHYKNRALKRLGLIHYSAQIKNPAYTPAVKADGKKVEDFFYKKYKQEYDNYLQNR